jgi:galactokinase
VNQALATFATLSGRPPLGSWMAPGRLNLIGEHTDTHDGFSLPIALGLGAYVAVATRGDGVLNAYSLQRPNEPLSIPLAELHPGTIAGWGAYAAGVLWKLSTEGHRVGGLDLVIDSDVPVGAGLSSSAALMCAIALASADVFELDLSRTDLASLAQRAEREFVGSPVGILDQSASLLCRANHALLLDARTVAGEQIPFGLAASGLELLVIDTRVRRRVRDGAYAERHRACDRAASALRVPALRDLVGPGGLDRIETLDDPLLRRRARHVVTENARVLKAAELLRAGEIALLGPLLSESHASLHDDFEVSTPALDAAVEASLGAGALGARMTGAGFGGSALALIHADESGRLTATVAEEFRRRGLAPPRVFAVNASAGARRVS